MSEDKNDLQKRLEEIDRLSQDQELAKPVCRGQQPKDPRSHRSRRQGFCLRLEASSCEFEFRFASNLLDFISISYLEAHLH